MPPLAPALDHPAGHLCLGGPYDGRTLHALGLAHDVPGQGRYVLGLAEWEWGTEWHWTWQGNR